MDFGGVLRRIATFLDARGEPWAVVGGVGLAALGLARTTLDLDLAVGESAQPELVSFLEALGYRTLYRSSGFSNHEHAESSLGRVDFLYLDPATARQLFDAAQELDGPGGLRVRVPSPEHLAAMKVAAMQSDPERAFQEMADIRFLLRLPGVNREQVRRYFVQHDLEERFRELAAEP